MSDPAAGLREDEVLAALDYAAEYITDIGTDSDGMDPEADKVLAALTKARAALATPAGLDEELRDALTELLDDYLATNGPDGYPHPMPMAWRLVAARIGRSRP